MLQLGSVSVVPFNKYVNFEFENITSVQVSEDVACVTPFG